MTPSNIDSAVARQAIDAKTKPLGALGQLEDMAVRLSVLQGPCRRASIAPASVSLALTTGLPPRASARTREK